MKLLRPLLAAGLALSPLALTAPALADAPGTSTATVVGTVRQTSPTTAEVRARYSCTGTTEQIHLWVSVKQSADATADPRLADPGTGFGTDEEGNPVPYRAAAWSQSHDTSHLVCDGTTHVDTFTVDHQEVGYGTLQKGDAWVQFCLFDATTMGPPISSMVFAHVR